jgi:uncharacterized repeat protein (TIGR02543 family)
MATKESGWYVDYEYSYTNTNTYVDVTVEAYWHNDGWRYSMGNNIYAWVYCNGEESQVCNNGSVQLGSDTHARQSLGSHTFRVYKSTSSKSVSVYAKIQSKNSYVQGTKTSSSSNISISALPSYTVSYNANGGSGAPGSQTKWYDQNLTLSNTRPSRTGYSFLRWNTNTSNTGTAYNPGATYSSNSNLALYAIWSPNTYTVSYNANGGSGAPGNQTKTYGVDLTLSSTIPTRSGYNFLGWATSSGGSVAYSAG